MIGVVLLTYFGLFLAPLVSPLAFAVTVGILLGFGLGLEFLSVVLSGVTWECMRNVNARTPPKWGLSG